MSLFSKLFSRADKHAPQPELKIHQTMIDQLERIKNDPRTPADQLGLIQSWIFELKRRKISLESGEILPSLIINDIKGIQQQARELIKRVLG